VRLAVDEEPGLAEDVPGVAPRELLHIPAARCERGAPRQRLRRRDAVDPAPVEDDRHRKFVAEGDVEGLTAPEGEFGPV
jgi:hypothetical protein